MFYKELRITDWDYLNNLKEDVKKNIKKSFTNVTNIQGHMTFYRHYIDNKLFESTDNTFTPMTNINILIISILIF